MPLVIHRRDDLGATDAAQALDPEAHRALEAHPGARRIPAEVVAYEPNVLHLQVDCPEEGWLLVTDRWARGWRATVNGKEVEVWGGNFVFRAVPVVRGPNDIRFRYHPFGFPGLLVLSWGLLAVVMLGSAGAWFRGHRRNDPG